MIQMVSLLFFSLLGMGLLAPAAFAGSLTISGWGEIAVETNGCEMVRVNVNSHLMSHAISNRVIGCSADPVVVGSTLLVTSGSSITWTTPVTAITAPVQDYSLSSVASAVTVLQTNAGTGGGSSEPFDYVKAAALFSFFFSFVVGVWIVGKNIGLILNAVRNW